MLLCLAGVEVQRLTNCIPVLKEFTADHIWRTKYRKKGGREGRKKKTLEECRGWDGNGWEEKNFVKRSPSKRKSWSQNELVTTEITFLIITKVMLFAELLLWARYWVKCFISSSDLNFTSTSPGRYRSLHVTAQGAKAQKG